MDNYKIGDEVELLEDFYTRSGAEIIFKKGTIAKVIELQLYDEIHIDVNGDNRWCSPDILKLVDKKDPALISGAEAKLAWANGVDIQIKNVNCVNWYDLDESKYNLDIFDNVRVDFRLKPQTIKLELELPKPFEPEEGEKYWWINPNAKLGYEWDTNDLERTDFNRIAMSVWRTEDEIKQVVEQLRKIRCTNS